jgi:hypothetical protein
MNEDAERKNREKRKRRRRRRENYMEKIRIGKKKIL